MSPLRVTWEFSTPVVRDSEHPIYLDALLAWAVADEAESFGHDDPWGAAANLAGALGRAHADSGEWVWQASEVVFEPATERFISAAVRRSDPEIYLDAIDRGLINQRFPRGVIRTNTGHERGYQLFWTYQWVAKACAWCVGDREGVTELLGRLSAIGKLTRNGFGVVKRFSVDVDDNAENLWRRRVLPEGIAGAAGVEYCSVQSCLRAPYWRKTAQVFAKVPLA